MQALTPPQGPLASQKFSVYSDQRYSEPCVPLVWVHNVFYSSVGGAVGRVLADGWGFRASEILAGDRGRSPTRTELSALPAFKDSFRACPSPPNLLCSSRARLVGRPQTGTGGPSLPPEGDPGKEGKTWAVGGHWRECLCEGSLSAGPGSAGGWLCDRGQVASRL